VVDIRFEGNHTFSDKELRKIISLEESSRILFWQNKYLNVGEIDNDQKRLETFYRMHGFMDAVVPPIQVVPYERKKKQDEDKSPEGEDANAPLGLENPIPGLTLPSELGEKPSAQLTLEPEIPDPARNTGQIGPEGVLPVAPADAGEQKELKRIRVFLQIHEGPRYTVNEIRTNIEAELPPGMVELLQRQISLREGGYFDLERKKEDERQMELALQHASYAWATVAGESVVIPSGNLVRVHYQVRPGTPTVFGHLQIEGLKEVQESIVVQRAARLIIPGRPFQPKLLENLQQQLYDLQLFQSVLVMPTEDSRGKLRVDVLIQVRERPFRLVQAGGGFSQESNWQELYLNGGWSHNYFKQRLMRLNLFGQVGWAFSPSVQAAFGEDSSAEDAVPVRNGPTADLRANLILPDFRARQVAINLGTRFLVGQTQSFGYMSPQLRFSVSRPLESSLVLQLGLGAEQYLPTPDAESRAIFEAADGTSSEATIRFNGLLTFLDQTVSYDRRDNILSTERGAFASIYLQEAGLLGNFSFIKFQPDVRGYYPVVERRLVAAGRLSTGFILPFAGESAPPVLRFETGGGASVRGYGRNQITWYTGNDCQVAQPDTTDTCNVATGGDLLYLASAELRAYYNSVGAAVFIDAGQVELADGGVLKAWLTPDLGRMQVGTGIGLRYKTVIGPIRLDFGYRLRDPFERDRSLKLFSENGCRCAIHLGIGEAF